MSQIKLRKKIYEQLIFFWWISQEIMCIWNYSPSSIFNLSEFFFLHVFFHSIEHIVFFYFCQKLSAYLNNLIEPLTKKKVPKQIDKGWFDKIIHQEFVMFNAHALF